MTTLASLLQNRAAEALGWTLVHFLWQGTVLAVVAFAVMRWLASTASARYIVGVTALALMVTAPVITFALTWQSSAATIPVAANALPAELVGAASASLVDPEQLMPVLLGLWLAGVVVLSIRLLGGWMVTRRLIARAVAPASAEIHAVAERVAARLALRHLARIVESSAVSVPVVIGWVKPVVLLPAAALSGLSMQQIESLLAHELAHVQRHDYIVNILQSAIETLFFYHPAVWLLSRRICIEREHCCDDLALSLCDRVVYVSALTDLAAMTMTPRLALAATDGHLLARVRRILSSAEPSRPISPWTAIGMLLVVVMSMTPAAIAARQDTPVAPRQIVAAPVEKATHAVPPPPPAPPTPAVTAQASSADIVGPSRAVDDATRRLPRPEVKAAEGATAQTQVDLPGAAPRRIKHVPPVYPQVARDAGLQGVVIMSATVRKDGTVGDVRVVRSAGVLDDAAVAAVRQWIYDPPRVDGQPIETTVSVTMNFTLGTGLVPATTPGLPNGRDEHSTSLPKVLKFVQPRYTQRAMKEKIQGDVIVQATVRRDGTVGAVKVMKSLDEDLDKQAIDAIRQCTFEPAKLNGEAIDFDTTLAFAFRIF